MATDNDRSTAGEAAFRPEWRPEATESLEAERETPVGLNDIDFNVRAEMGLLNGKQLTNHVASYNARHETRDGELDALLDRKDRSPQEEERVRDIVIRGSQDAFEALNALEANGVDTENSRALYGIEMVLLLDNRERTEDPEGQAYPNAMKAVTGKEDDTGTETTEDEDEEDPTGDAEVQGLRRRGRGRRTENHVADAVKQIALTLAGAELLDFTATAWPDNPISGAMEAALGATEETEHISAEDSAKLLETYGQTNNMNTELADVTSDGASLDQTSPPNPEEGNAANHRPEPTPDENLEGQAGFKEPTPGEESSA